MLNAERTVVIVVERSPEPQTAHTCSVSILLSHPDRSNLPVSVSAGGFLLLDVFIRNIGVRARLWIIDG